MNSIEKIFLENFKENNPQINDPHFGSSWSFGDSKEMANELAELTLKGIKTATASAYIQYKLADEEMPIINKNRYDILLNGDNVPVAIVQTSKVYVTTFDKVTEEHAFKEGEGDRSLEYWKRVHLEFWTNIFKLENIQGTDIETMKIVCEELQLIWR